MDKGYLVLQNGQVFEGLAFGADAPRVGELVFTTGMCGYVETLTDPSYAGQIVLQTFPMIGNYGVAEADFEGACTLNGYVVREWCEHPSNFRSEYDLDALLKKQGVMGLCGIDTRQVTKILRDEGVMNAMLCRQIPGDLSVLGTYRVTGEVRKNTCEQEHFFEPMGEKKYEVTLIDYGAKHHIVTMLRKRGCRVRVVPAGTAAEEILEKNPDGVMLSNGPGDPAENVFEIEQIRKLLGRVPLFGICLGHQLCALAAGGRTVKLPYGHRGANQPVKEAAGERTFITSQNHGYAVDAASLQGTAELRFVNANDGTCEGLTYPELDAFTVQFHPEAHAGPQDTDFLFDEFTARMDKRKGEN